MFMNAKKELSLSNPTYKKAVQLYVWGTYKQDLFKSDSTTKYFLSRKKREIKAEITSNEIGVLAGVEEARWLLDRIGIKIIKCLKDGSVIKSGDVIMKISGSAHNILSVERTLLNLLQRMSGVATSANNLASKLPKEINLLSTRKTLWGQLDKKATALGGAFTHRLNLNDAILIKDNHLLLEPDWQKRFKILLKKNPKVRFIEIEVESREEAEDFLTFYKEIKSKLLKNQNIVVMLDNFKPISIKKIALKLKKAGLIVEVSGGINIDNVKSYAISGVSVISSGAITMNANSLDISLSII